MNLNRIKSLITIGKGTYKYADVSIVLIDITDQILLKIAK